MIKNIDSNIKKYNANDVYVGKINIIDYINNKLIKIQNDVTSFNTFEFGINIKDHEATLNTTPQNIIFKGDGINNISQYFGAKNMFEINDDYIEYIGENTQNGSNDYTKIYFTINLRGLTSTTFNLDQFNSIIIQVVDSSGNEKASAYQSITVPSQNTRYSLDTTLVCNLVKGDKIYFKCYSQKTVNVSLNKGHITIINHSNLPDEYYDFKY